MPTVNTAADYLSQIDQLVHQKTGQFLSNIQRLVLSECLQPVKVTYDEIAKKNNYSGRYIQQRVAPDMWYLMTEIIGTKVNKANCRSVLIGYLDRQALQQPSQAIAQANNQAQLASYGPSSYGPYSDSPVAYSVEQREYFCDRKTDASAALEFPTESVPIGSPFYIQREPHESQCHQLIQRPGALIRIKAPRQMGKTSLMNRIIAQANNYPSIILNFQQTDQTILKDLDKLLRWVSANITRQLKLPSALDDFWDEEIGSKMSCTIYLEEYILEEIDTPVILVLEESSELFEHEDVFRAFFGMLRTWYEYTKHNEAWKKLRLILVQSTETYVQLNVNQSPFNVGFEVALEPFNHSQADILAKRSGLPLSEAQTNQLMCLLTGHPYLIRLALYYLATKRLQWNQLIASASTDNGIFKHHLQRHLWHLQQQDAIAAAFKTVLSHSSPVKIEQIHAFKLQSMGLVTIEGNQVQISCDLYRTYFSEHL